MELNRLSGLGQKKEIVRRLPATTVKEYNVQSPEDAERERVASARGQVALAALRERQVSDIAAKTCHIRSRRAALQIESERAKIVSSLPPPAKELPKKIEKERAVDVVDYKRMGISRIPIKRNALCKGPFFAGVEVDACAAVVEHEKQQAPPSDCKESEKKAKSRYLAALKKEKTTKGYSELLKELEDHTQKTNKARSLAKKKPFKMPVGAATQSTTVRSDEKALERVVEDVMRWTKGTASTVGLDKKRTKRAARLSIGKSRAVKTPKGTLVTKMSALGAAPSGKLTHLQERSRLQISIHQQSKRGQTISASASVQRGDVPVEPVAQPVPSKTSPLAIPRPSESSCPQSSDSQPPITEKLSPTRDTAAQTIMTYHNLGSEPYSGSPPSSTSYLSLPFEYGYSQTAAQLISKETQTPGDPTTVYQQYLLNRAKKVDCSSAIGSERDARPSTSTRPKHSLNLFVKELAKKYFSETENAEEARPTQTFEFFAAANDILDRRHRISPTTCSLKNATVNAVKMERVEKLFPSPPIQSRRKEKSLTSYSKMAACTSAKKRTKKSADLAEAQKSPVAADSVPTTASPDFSSGAAQSPVFNVVFQHFGGGEGSAPCNLNLLVPRNLNTSVENSDYNSLYLHYQESPDKSEEDVDVSSSTNRVCRLERLHFRPHPPASLPLGWRQMQSPHELSTICELDTPQTSLFDKSNPSGVAHQQAKSPSLEVLKTETSCSVQHALTWEDVFAVCKTAPSPSPEKRLYSRAEYLPSQSTPKEHSTDGHLEELDIGIQDQSVISLVGSEVTVGGDDHQVPDTSKCLLTTALSDALPCCFNPPAHVSHSKSRVASASLLSFLGHEESCAANPQ